MHRFFFYCFQCFDAFGCAAGRASSLRKTEWWTGGMLAWLCVWVMVQICIWSSWCHCHSLSLAPANPDWFYLPSFTFLVPAHPGSPRQNPEGRKMVVCIPVCVCAPIVFFSKANLWDQLKIRKIVTLYMWHGCQFNGHVLVWVGPSPNLSGSKTKILQWCQWAIFALFS